MKKFFFTVFSLCLIASTLSFAQDTGKTNTDTGNEPLPADNSQVYRDIILEDFETSTYTDQNISIRESRDQKASLMMREDLPAPANNSKKYLGIKIFGKSGDVSTIKPIKDIEIKQYCQSISIWVYGKNLSGELSILISDANGNTHRITFGKLNFLGWRKLTTTLSKEVAQQDKLLNQPRSIKISKILYNPGSTGEQPVWNYIYLDEITAKVREKYIDNQKDNW